MEMLIFFWRRPGCCVVELLKFFRLRLLGFLLLGLSGCIEFEEEEVQWRYLPDEDVLLVALRYEGIHGGDGKRDGEGKGEKKPAAAELDDGEIGQLDAVMKGGRAFFFNNWIFEFNRRQLEEFLKKQGEETGLPQARLTQLLLKEVEVRNVGFFLDGRGHLCGAQTLQVGNVSGLLGLTNELVAEKLLEAVAKKLDGGHSSTSVEKDKGGSRTMSPLGLLKRLERVHFEQLRLSGATRIKGRYRVNLVDPREGRSFWLEEGGRSYGYELLEMDYKGGFARIRKNGQTAIVHLKSRSVVAEADAKDDVSLESMQAWVRAAEEKFPFARVGRPGFVLRMPIAEKEFEEFREKGKANFPDGMSMDYGDGIMEMSLGQSGARGGILRKECFPGYVPNALAHVREKYGLLKRADVELELKQFLAGGGNPN
jgi:hypothetical protein